MKKKRVVVILIVIAVVSVAALLPVFAKNSEGFGKKSTKYTKESLEENLGIERLLEDEEKIADIDAIYLNPAGKKENLQDYLYFYLFKSEKDARKALEYIKNTRIDGGNDMVIENGTLEGFVIDVMDGDMEMYMVQRNNIIVFCMATYGNFCSDEELDEMIAANKASEERYHIVKQFVDEKFK